MSLLTLMGALAGAAAALVGALLVTGVLGHPIDGQLPADWGWSLVMIGVALVAGCCARPLAALWRRRAGHG